MGKRDTYVVKRFNMMHIGNTPRHNRINREQPVCSKKLLYVQGEYGYKIMSVCVCVRKTIFIYTQYIYIYINIYI